MGTWYGVASVGEHTRGGSERVTMCCGRARDNQGNSDVFVRRVYVKQRKLVLGRKPHTITATTSTTYLHVTLTITTDLIHVSYCLAGCIVCFGVCNILGSKTRIDGMLLVQDLNAVRRGHENW